MEQVGLVSVPGALLDRHDAVQFAVVPQQALAVQVARIYIPDAHAVSNKPLARITGQAFHSIEMLPVIQETVHHYTRLPPIDGRHPEQPERSEKRSTILLHGSPLCVVGLSTGRVNATWLTPKAHLILMTNSIFLS